MTTRYCATGAQAIIDDDRIVLRVGALVDDHEVVDVEFDIEPFALQLANQILGTVVHQIAEREDRQE